jgi:Tfp pilus assembly protein PilN
MRAVNLIPDELRGDAALGGGRSGGGAFAVLGLLAGLTMLALIYGIAHHHVSSRKAQLAAISAREQQANATAGQLQAYTSFLSARDTRTETVKQLAESRFAWAHALYELGRVLPAGVSISSLTGSVGDGSTSGSGASSSPASSKSSATPPGSIPALTLSGCATSQKMVATMLNRLSLIHGVSEATLQGSSNGGQGTGGGSSGAGGGNCPTGAPSFTVQVSYEPLPASASGSASPAPASSDASNSTLQKAQSTGGAG